jgi:hypothetical protein
MLASLAIFLAETYTTYALLTSLLHLTKSHNTTTSLLAITYLTTYTTTTLLHLLSPISSVLYSICNIQYGPAFSSLF